MDFDKTQLLVCIIDARRNKDTEALSWHIMRYLCTFDDNVVYSPSGVAKLLQSTTSISRASSFRVIEQLQDRLKLSKLDEFSLQLNDQFSSKGSQSVKYEGPRLAFTSEEVKYLMDLDTARAEIWAKRGKNKRRIKKDDEVISVMKKRFDEVQKENKEMKSMLARQGEILEFLMARAKGEDVVEAKTQLRLIKTED